MKTSVNFSSSVLSRVDHNYVLLNAYNPTRGQSHVLKTYKNSNQLQQIIFLEHSIYTIIINYVLHMEQNNDFIILRVPECFKCHAEHYDIWLRIRSWIHFLQLYYKLSTVYCRKRGGGVKQGMNAGTFPRGIQQLNFYWNTNYNG